jgi:hypothetical protein
MRAGPYFKYHTFSMEEKKGPNILRDSLTRLGRAADSFFGQIKNSWYFRKTFVYQFYCVSIKKLINEHDHPESHFP